MVYIFTIYQRNEQLLSTASRGAAVASSTHSRKSLIPHGPLGKDSNHSCLGQGFVWVRLPPSSYWVTKMWHNEPEKNKQAKRISFSCSCCIYHNGNTIIYPKMQDNIYKQTSKSSLCQSWPGILKIYNLRLKLEVIGCR